MSLEQVIEYQMEQLRKCIAGELWKDAERRVYLLQRMIELQTRALGLA